MYCWYHTYKYETRINKILRRKMMVVHVKFLLPADSTPKEINPHRTKL
jgi:hypothetical protein